MCRFFTTVHVSQYTALALYGQKINQNCFHLPTSTHRLMGCFGPEYSIYKQTAANVALKVMFCRSRCKIRVVHLEKLCRQIGGDLMVRRVFLERLVDSIVSDMARRRIPLIPDIVSLFCWQHVSTLWFTGRTGLAFQVQGYLTYLRGCGVGSGCNLTRIGYLGKL